MLSAQGADKCSGNQQHVVLAPSVAITNVGSPPVSASPTSNASIHSCMLVMDAFTRTDLDKAHVNDLKEEAAKQRRLLALEEDDSLQDTVPLPCRMRPAVHVCRCLEQWQRPPTPPVPGNPKSGGPSGPSSSNSSPAAVPSAAAAAAHVLALPRIGKGLAEQREFVFNSAIQIGRWLAPIKPHLLHLAAASSAGTSLEANLKHISVTLATWDAVWEVYLDPKWAQQRLRLYGAQERALEHFFKKPPRVQLEEYMAEVSMEHYGRAKQLAVFFVVAGGGTGGGWGAGAVLRGCCKVVCRPRGNDQLRGRVVLVDEHRTSRVSSAVNGQQPCESRLNQRRATRPAGWKPPAGQVEHRLVRPAWSQQRDQPVLGLMWRPVVPPRHTQQAPRSSQEASQPAASEPGPSTPLPAKRSKRTKAEPA
ncbi:hypothetical protein QJQ45_004316 [Haematococcus lacustris]|nr:hypothetical protein QJQ45_004316 [Haematococcus lacustris]